MIKNLYKVSLEGYSTQVRAFNKEEAVILAQAEAIENACKYKLLDITCIG
ncbi:hypothetical protein GAG94_03280 [Lysinibacillus sphaericus]|nr:hypothetical protein GAG94_03280 [Lysinibacillus sphaericus]